MMIPLMGKTEFAQRARDPRLAYANYVAKAENLVARIPNAAKKIGDANWLRDADPGMLVSMTAAQRIAELARPILTWMITGFLISAILTAPCIAATDIQSTGNDFSDNPFMVLGVNPATHLVTGYFSAHRTAPDRTDACKFVFRGASSPNGKASLSVKDALQPSQENLRPQGKVFATLTAAKDTIRIDLPNALLPADCDCDWVLDWVAGPHISTRPGAYVISFDTRPKADWIGVVAIRSKRAFFHDVPDIAAVRKAFLVAGDVAYVTDERPGWYRVRFTHALKHTVGWIKVSDTIQFQGAKFDGLP